MYDIKVEEPIYIPLRRKTDPYDYIYEIEDLYDDVEDIMIVLCVLDWYQVNYYNLIKQFCCNELDIPTQCVKKNTIFKGKSV